MASTDAPLAEIINATRAAVSADPTAAQVAFHADHALLGPTEVDVRGFFGVDDRVRPGFGAVRVKVALGGPEPIARYKELAEAVDRHCPVLDIFRNKVPVERSVEAVQGSTAHVKTA